MGNVIQFADDYRMQVTQTRTSWNFALINNVLRTYRLNGNTLTPLTARSMSTKTVQGRLLGWNLTKWWGLGVCNAKRSAPGQWSRHLSCLGCLRLVHPNRCEPVDIQYLTNSGTWQVDAPENQLRPALWKGKVKPGSIEYTKRIPSFSNNTPSSAVNSTIITPLPLKVTTRTFLADVPALGSIYELRGKHPTVGGADWRVPSPSTATQRTCLGISSSG